MIHARSGFCHGSGIVYVTHDKAEYERIMEQECKDVLIILTILIVAGCAFVWWLRRW